MARAPSKKKTTTESGGRGLRERKTINYNEHKLAVAASRVPEAPKKKKEEVAPKKKSTTTKTKGKKGTGTTYLVLVKRALKDVEHPGWGVASIVNYLAEHTPDKTNRRFIRQALNSGVEKSLFVKTKGSYRLSKKTQDQMDRVPKKKTTKKAATKKATTKKATTKKSTTKKGTKKDTKKKTTKKTTKDTKTKPKKVKETKEKATRKKKAEDDEHEKAPTPKKGKKVIGPPTGDDSTTVSEAAGVWQYYDGGWHNYASDASMIVEGVYQEFIAAGEGSGLDIRAIQSGHFSYMVNFKDMEQTNTSTSTKRKIRRV